MFMLTDKTMNSPFPKTKGHCSRKNQHKYLFIRFIYWKYFDQKGSAKNNTKLERNALQEDRKGKHKFKNLMNSSQLAMIS